MILYLLRHGIAEDHARRGGDAERELTDEGKDRTRNTLLAARKMKLLPPQLVISSSLRRAQQTAEIALESFAKGAEFETSEALTPMSELSLTMALVTERAKVYNGIMLVGHEPHLSHFGSALLGSTTPVLEMKKASLAKFEIQRFDVPRMRGFLVALLPPKIGEVCL